MGERAGEAELLQLPLPELGGERMRLRQPGRPAGAEGRAKRQMREHLAALGYRDPLIVLAETWSRPAADLARQLGISMADAFALQMRAAAEGVPYLHGKMPTVEVQPDEKLPVLILELGTNQLDIDRGRIDGGQAGAPLSVGLPLLENQGLSGNGGRASHAEPVSRDAKDEGYQGDDGHETDD